MNGYNQTPYRLGRRPGKQGPRPLPDNQGRVEKLATGKTDVMTRTKDTNRGTGVTTIKTNDGAQRLKITKDIFTVGTWNVQTLWTTGKLELLRNEMKRFRFDVVGISEVRWTGKGETPRGDFIWSGENTTHTKGVGLLLSTKAKKAMIGYNPISSRLISVRFNATPFKITVIHVYALTSASSEDEIEAFYENIEKELSRTSKKDLIIITGDWNAKVGSDNTNWENTMDPYLAEEQAGFRKDRSTVQQILTLRLLAEKAKRQGIKIYNCFIDFRKAFDTIKHNIIWAVLKSYGIGNKILALLQNIYEQAQSAVRVDKQIGEWFHTSVGTRQGDPLSPLLFITYLERVMDKAIQTDSGISISGTLVNNLRFADDINMIQEDRNMLLKQTERLQTVATQAGLTINTGKTKTLVFGGPNIEQPIQISGNLDFHERIKPVEQASKMSDIWLIENIWAYNKEKLEEEFENIPLLKKEL
ncbi:unnamed protein product [Rotaria socialis]